MHTPYDLLTRDQKNNIESFCAKWDDQRKTKSVEYRLHGSLNPFLLHCGLVMSTMRSAWGGFDGDSQQSYKKQRQKGVRPAKPWQKEPPPELHAPFSFRKLPRPPGVEARISKLNKLCGVTNNDK